MRALAYFGRLLEILVARVLPGVLNVLAVLILGGRMSVESYGIFSTTIATSGLLGSLIFGLLSGAIVPQYRQLSLEKGDLVVQGQIIGAGLQISLIVFLVSVVLQFVYVGALWFGLLLVFSGLQTVFLAIIQAKIKFWVYGAVSGLQAICFLIFILFFVGVDSSFIEPVRLYAASIGFAVVLGYFLLGAPKVFFWDWKAITPLIRLGSQVTGGGLAESTMFLGFRYVLVVLGERALLGQFSLLLDVAQRTVGVAVNIVGFSVLPRAYKIAADGDLRLFKVSLLRGAGAALILTAVVFFGVVVASYFHIFAVLNDSRFSIWFFLLVSLGVILNRLKKLILDPLVIQKGKAYLIFWSYSISGIISLAVAYSAVAEGVFSAFYWVYLCGYVGVIFLTLMMLSLVVRRAGG